MLTPQGVDVGRPFPHISSGSLESPGADPGWYRKRTLCPHKGSQDLSLVLFLWEVPKFCPPSLPKIPSRGRGHTVLSGWKMW